MGRRYKIIVFSLIFIFIMTESVSAYQIYDFNLQEYRNLIRGTSLKEACISGIDILAYTNEPKTTRKIEYKVIEKEKLINYKPKSPIVEVENQIEEKKEVISLNDEQLYLLSKLVAAEARGETYKGQVAVAAVVLNRVKDSRFPDSIEGVIYQKNAFSVVKNGYIDILPTEESYNAAKEALYGNDPTNEAIYFWNPDISTCSWINTLNPHMRIGNHVFAR